MTTRRIQPYRRLVHYLLLTLFVGLPFVRVGGESAFRFDVPSLRLHVFGTSLWMNEFFIVLAATLFLTFLFLAVTVLYGRIWCGWLCPQELLSNLSAADKQGKARRNRRKSSQVKIIALSLLVGAASIWYFVPPYRFIADLAAGRLHPVAAWSWVLLTLLTWLNLALVRERFCATICPYSRLQGVLLDSGTMVIAYDPARAESCLGCSGCVKACPVGIDIKDGLQAACLNCAECVDACARIQERKGQTSLIGYFFGSPGQPFRPLRLPAVLTGSATAFFLVFLMVLVVHRSPVDLTLLPNVSHQARPGPEGRLLASWLAAVENKGKETRYFTLSAEMDGAPLDISPANVEIAPGEYMKIPVYVVQTGEGPVDIILADREGLVLRSRAPLYMTGVK